MGVLLITIGLLGAGLGWWLVESGRRRRHPVPEGHQAGVEIPHTGEFELYHNALSLCSMKTRVCLAELGIPYVSHHVDLIETGAYENIRAGFLRVNPGGTVPVLVHDGHPVYESHAQIRYAAAHAPEGSPSLTPADPSLREEMERWIDRSSLSGNPLENGEKSAGNAVPRLTIPLFGAMIEQIAWWKILEGLLFHFDRMRPTLFLTMKARGLSGMARMKPLMEAFGVGVKQMAAHLDALEAQLEKTGGPWILGEIFSLADVSWLVIFERLAQADLLGVFVGETLRPGCDRYWARLKERPSYRLAILDHSHPTISYGTRRLVEGKAADPALRIALEGA